MALLTRDKQPAPKIDAEGLEIDEAAIYCAVDSFCCGRLTILRGSRLRGSHEAVGLSPRMFARDGLSDDELGVLRNTLYSGGEAI